MSWWDPPTISEDEGPSISGFLPCRACFGDCVSSSTTVKSITRSLQLTLKDNDSLGQVYTSIDSFARACKGTCGLFTVPIMRRQIGRCGFSARLHSTILDGGTFLDQSRPPPPASAFLLGPASQPTSQPARASSRLPRSGNDPPARGLYQRKRRLRRLAGTTGIGRR